jgi:roadblock/LC7 domain-containing protein
MFDELLKITGSLKIDVFSSDGALKDSREVKNLVVTSGKTFIASRMVGTASNVMSHMELGTGTTAAAVGNTTLETAISASRTALSSGTSSTNVVTYVASFPAGTGTGAVTEAGIFNAASAGTMLCRTVFSVVNKGADDAMSITWTITVS